MKRILLFGTVSLALVLLTIVVPQVIFRKTGRHFITELLSNIRQIGLLLFDSNKNTAAFPTHLLSPPSKPPPAPPSIWETAARMISYAN